MGQAISSTPKCNGCNKTTPFFGEMYGRMSGKVHGSRLSGMGHSLVGNTDSDDLKTEFSEFNKFKNKLLIPFYGTALAIRVLIAGLMRDIKKWQNLGLSQNLALDLINNKTLKAWFTLRIVTSLIPGVGTVVNGSLDIISQIGIQFRSRGTASVERKVTAL